MLHCCREDGYDSSWSFPVNSLCICWSAVASLVAGRVRDAVQDDSGRVLPSARVEAE